MKWKDKLISDVIAKLAKQNNSLSLLQNSFERPAVSIHLAIFSEPFLGFIFNGRKTIETRLSINNVLPYRRVNQNDLVLIKKAGGPVVGIFSVAQVNYYSNLNADKVSKLEEKYGVAACWDSDPQFKESKSSAKFATVIYIEGIQHVDPVDAGKSDRTAWSIIRNGLANTLFDVKH